MTTETITLKICESGSTRWYEQDVVADVVAGWAIHPTVGREKLWTVTHVKSGLSAEHFLKSEGRAIEYRARLLDVQVNGVFLADFDTCDALAVAPVAIRQLAEYYGMEPDECSENARQAAMSTARLICPVQS